MSADSTTMSSKAPRLGRSSSREIGRTLIYYSGVTLLDFIMIYPILWLFASSLRGPSEIWTYVSSLIPRDLAIHSFPGLENLCQSVGPNGLGRYFYHDEFVLNTGLCYIYPVPAVFG
jgi:ABC-type maltose transport system permease subunit